VEQTEGLVNLHARDDEARVAGYSVPFLSRVFDALDPDTRTPSATVQMRTKKDSKAVHRCGCKEHGSRPVSAAAAREDQETRARDIRNLITAPVPDFLVELRVHILPPWLQDIIVGTNATLVLDDSVAFMVARNILCYQGSRIVQKSAHLNADIVGTMRGGIPNYVKFFTLADVLKIRMHELQLVSPAKP
jgi:hypothetical protein